MEVQSDIGMQESVSEVPTAHMELLVTDDKMEAVLVVSETQDLVSADAEAMLKEVLTQKGVVYGLEEESIQQFIDEIHVPGEKKYIIARGTPPQSGQDAAILFKIGNEKRPGTLREYAKMDFRDRGGVFQANEGDVIAVKIPMVKGAEGKTVTGKNVPAPAVKDVSLKLGKNVQVIDDKVQAKVSGIVCQSGVADIDISPVLTVNGDVDFEVGNIDFNGLVEVFGSILSGFKVRAGSLIATFVEHDTKLEIKGDMVIKEGLIGSDARVGGVLKCAYVKGTRIVSENDIIVETEIVDSELTSLGKVLVTRQNGRIINSTISARLGIETNNFGSRTSPYCMAILAADHRRDEQIQILNHEIHSFEENLKKLEKKFKEITVLKQEVEKSVKKLREQLPAVIDTRQKYRMQVQIKAMIEKYKELEKNYELLLDAIVSYKGQKREKETQRDQLLAESVRVEPDIYLKVSGLLHEGSVIRGKSSKLDIKETVEAVRAHESTFIEELENGLEKEIIRVELVSL